MECPKCGNTDTQVIDSKLSKDESKIRRRRQCTECSARFTTYEAAEEKEDSQMQTDNGSDETKETISKLSAIKISLESLCKETEKLIGKLSQETEKLMGKTGSPEENAPPAESEAEEKAEEKKAVTKKVKAEKKPTEKKSDVPESEDESDDRTATEAVLKIIRQSKKGVDIAKLKEKTGFNDKKIRNIVHRASKQGKIKRSGRGIYVIA
ncbi:MAG: hypothetical protein BWK80_14345 [Desulfobacteraceae bacterium IS3]|nr:MAG: hypothetical protein BWK80_14345 [Desulfobacteraceae bacterium IS3]